MSKRKPSVPVGFQFKSMLSNDVVTGTGPRKPGRPPVNKEQKVAAAEPQIDVVIVDAPNAVLQASEGDIDPLPQPEENQDGDSDAEDMDWSDSGDSEDDGKPKRNWREADKKREFDPAWLSLEEEFACFEFTTHPDGKVTIKCGPCSLVCGKDKLITQMKRDNLYKHCGIAMPGSKRAAALTKLGVHHKKNVQDLESLRIAQASAELGREKAYQFQAAIKDGNLAAKIVQLKTVMHMLGHGRSMLQYEDMKEYLLALGYKPIAAKHWSDNSGWGFGEALAEVCRAQLEKDIKAANFISFSADEVTDCATTQWLGLHVYVMQDWRRKALFLQVAKVVDAPTADTLRALTLESLQRNVGVDLEWLGKHLVCAGTDGASVMLGERAGLCAQLIYEVAPYMQAIHCFAHRTDLAAGALSLVPLVEKLETFVKAMYNYFSRSPKRCNELKEFAEIAETAGLKILRDVDTRWISLDKPLQRVVDELSALLLKFANDASNNSEATWVYNQLTDMDVLVALHGMLPMMAQLRLLIKAAQQREVFIQDLLDVLAGVISSLKEIYTFPVPMPGNEETRPFLHPAFVASGLTQLLYGDESESKLQWHPPGQRQQQLVYKVKDEHFPITVVPPKSGDRGRPRSLAEDITGNSQLLGSIKSIADQLTAACDDLVAELHERFPTTELLSAQSIIYPQYWDKNPDDSDLNKRLKVIKDQYCKPNSVTGPAFTMLNGADLDRQTKLFVKIMRSKAVERAAQESKEPGSGKKDESPASTMWRSITQNQFFKTQLSAFVLLAELVLVTVPGSVEEERTNSDLSWIKNDRRNRLEEPHLNVCLRVFSQEWFKLDSFPYLEAYKIWEDMCRRRGVATCIVE